MGLFQTYLVYKYGKRRAEREQAAEDEYWSEACTKCGYERRQHADDAQQSCPTY